MVAWQVLEGTSFRAMENTLNNSLRQSEHSPHPSDPSYFPPPMYPSLNFLENECHPHQQPSRHPAPSGINHDFPPFFPLTEDQTHSPTNDTGTLESPEQRSMLLQITERSHNEPPAPSLGLHIRQESLVGGAESQATSFLPNLRTARLQISSNILGVLSPLPVLPEDGAYNPVAAYAAASQPYACFPVMPMNPQSRPPSRSQDGAYRSPTDCVVNQPSFHEGSRIPSVVWNTRNGVLPFPDYQSPFSSQDTTGTPASRPRQSERRALTRSTESNQFPLPSCVDHETCALVDAALAASSIPSPPISSPVATNANCIDPLCRQPGHRWHTM
ncbi:hypothetical protein BD410DRAFT_845299 [Rickenella mellea]|uniref:Uncharacterized protein n=1 Tax=Rickenella mellea TaxID=50990 RepID=A0A4Y7PJQ5_9AGAM|nr:hypothetical protein BD410DRAFT_845299 [Rickenella mellea]